MNRTTFGIAELGAALARQLPNTSTGIIGGAVANLIRIAGQIHSLMECYCNRGLTERQKAREKRLTKEAAAAAADLGMVAYIQRDPRGGTIYIAPKGTGEDSYPMPPWIFIA